MYGRSLHANREISSLTIRHATGWSASGRRGAVADDAGAGEVRPLHSSGEAGEQLRRIGGGVGGAKGGGRGEHEQAPHAPDTEPGKCVSGTLACTRASQDREEGTVHRSTSPCGCGSAAGSVFLAQAGCGARGGWTDMGRVGAEPRSELAGCV